MAKVHTVEDLDQRIDAEIGWRKQELTTALTSVQLSSGRVQSANLRAGILILYAHWEGWVKAVAKLYIRYVNTKSISYDGLSVAFLGNALKAKMTAVDEATSSTVHNQFAAFLRTELSRRAVLSESLVRTESNLSSTVLFDIIDRLGLERRPQYVLRAKMIDADLVNRRNTIAHGEYLDLTVQEFVQLRAETLDILELFTDDVRNAASTGRHLATPTSQV